MDEYVPADLAVAPKSGGVMAVRDAAVFWDVSETSVWHWIRTGDLPAVRIGGGTRSGAGHLNLNNWRKRDWYPALDAAGLTKCGPYALRHTFATTALAAGIGIFELARYMGTSVDMIDQTYGHLVADHADVARQKLDSYAGTVEASAGV